MGENKDKLFLNTNMYLFSFEMPIGVLKIDLHNLIILIEHVEMTVL